MSSILLAFETTATFNTFLIGLLILVLILVLFGLARYIKKTILIIRQQDWDRQDEVAVRVEEVAKKAVEAAKLVVDRQNEIDKRTKEVAEKTATVADLVLERQKVLDKKTDEVARLVAVANDATLEQIVVINKLVNNQITQSIRSELDATRDTLALLSELVAHRKQAGIEPNVEVIAALRGREVKIKELMEMLEDREKEFPMTRPKG